MHDLRFAHVLDLDSFTEGLDFFASGPAYRADEVLRTCERNRDHLAALLDHPTLSPLIATVAPAEHHTVRQSRDTFTDNLADEPSLTGRRSWQTLGYLRTPAALRSQRGAWHERYRKAVVQAANALEDACDRVHMHLDQSHLDRLHHRYENQRALLIKDLVLATPTELDTFRDRVGVTFMPENYPDLTADHGTLTTIILSQLQRCVSERVVFSLQSLRTTRSHRQAIADSTRDTLLALHQVLRTPLCLQESVDRW